MHVILYLKALLILPQGLERCSTQQEVVITYPIWHTLLLLQIPDPDDVHDDGHSVGECF